MWRVSKGNRDLFLTLRRFDARPFTAHSEADFSNDVQIRAVGDGGEIGPGPGTGNSSGVDGGNSSGLCGSPGSRTGGEISGLGFPGGSSSGGSVGCPGLIGGSSGSIGMMSRPLRYPS
jgi:hypothetical protein